MERDEYEQLMEYIYRRYIRASASQMILEHYSYEAYLRQRVQRAARLLRTVEEISRTDEEIYDIFQKKGLARAVGDVADGVDQKSGRRNRYVGGH
jgi:hypothetical protein